MAAERLLKEAAQRREDAALREKEAALMEKTALEEERKQFTADMSQQLKEDSDALRKERRPGGAGERLRGCEERSDELRRGAYGVLILSANSSLRKVAAADFDTIF